MSVSSSATSVGTSAGQGLLAVPGIGTGLNITSIINALMQSYNQPITQLQGQQAQFNAVAALWQGISTDLQSLGSDATALSTPADWGATTVTSSNPSAATGITTSSAATGSVSFVVDQIAQGESLVSSGSVASASDVVTSASSLLVSSGTLALGLSSMSGSSLALGSHSISVTQASAAATDAGSAAPSASTTISSSNDSLAVSVDGTAYSLTLASGTYTSTQLAQAVAAAATAAGAPLSASIASSGDLQLSSTNQGSSATLQVTGGTALSALGLSAMPSAASGTDAVINVDGTSTTLSDLTAGATLALTSGTGGTLDAVVGPNAHLAVGTLSAENVSTGNGSLADVVSAVNSAGAGVSASDLSNGAGGYLLDLSATATGNDANVGVAPGSFSSSGLGSLQVSQRAQDSTISLGGVQGPTVSSATDQIVGLLPGLTANLVSVSSTPVTLQVAPDASAMASKLSALVDAANKVLADISSQSQYDSSTKTGGPLLGSGLAEQVTQQVLNEFSTVAGISGLGNAAAAGITESNGQLTFDKTTFESAFSANPSAISSLFAQGGSFAPSASTYSGQASLVYAGNATAPGTYQVVVDHSATQAVDTGTVGYTSGSSTVPSADTLTVTSAGVTSTYSVTAGESLSGITQGLDAAFASSGSNLSAQVVASGGSSHLQIASSGYGSAQSFAVSTSSAGELGVSGNFAGTDVSGTIGGVAATGTGQILSVPVSNPTLAGLSLQVTSAGITSATSIGAFTYNPGVAAHIATLASSLTSPGGQITSQISSDQAQASQLNPQIASYQQIASEEKLLLEQTYSQLDATLAGLQQTSSLLSTQFAGASASLSSSPSGSTLA